MKRKLQLTEPIARIQGESNLYHMVTMICLTNNMRNMAVRSYGGKHWKEGCVGAEGILDFFFPTSKPRK